MVKKILKAVVILICTAGAVGLVLWLVLAGGYPWWVGAAVLLGLCGVAVGYIFIRRHLRRRKEEEFVRRVIVQDEEAIKTAPPEEKPHLRELQAKWKESVDTLRNSYLRKRGNPLYVLPWFLVLGESGSGKTSAIKNTKLNSPIGELSLTAGISVTRNCDWWFFEEAIILDTAGRYTIPIDEGIDREEWEKFLSLLAKYRKREPVNGIIITIAADKLREMNEAKLGDEGQNVRKRIDQLMRIMGASIPVYVLVTKIDLIPGMFEFSNLLPPKSRNQAMGYVNRGLEAGWERVLDDAMTAVSRRLKELQFVLIHRGGEQEPEIFLFSHGFERLRSGLGLFMQAVFKSNPYQATPPLRGVFFSSAIQEGKPRPEFTGFITAQDDERREVIHNTGLFLKDFFQCILPQDRNLFSPIPEFLRTQRTSLLIGLGSWALLWACVCGIMGFSYVNARSSVSTALSGAPRIPELSGKASLDLLALNRLVTVIKRVEKVNRKWFVPVAGFRQGFEVEERMKARFVSLYRDKALRPFDASLIGGLDAVWEDSLGTERMNRFGCLVARIGLLREYPGEEMKDSFEKFRDLADSLLTAADPELTPGVAALFGDAYLDYLAWDTDRKTPERELTELLGVLERVLRNRENLRRVALAWIDPPPDLRMIEYWAELGEIAYDDRVTISGVYTEESRKQIEAFFGILETSVADTRVIVKEKQDFWNWYQSQSYEAWSTFALSFPREAEGIDRVPGGRQIVSSMATPHNPYFDFLDRMAKELAGIPQVSGEPSWVSLVLELDRVRALAGIATGKEPATLLERIENQKNKMLRKTVGRVDKRQAAELKTREDAAKVWGEYLSTIEQLAQVVSSPEVCFKTISDYNTDAGKAASPFTAALNRCLKLQTLLKREDAPFVWDLVLGPQRFLLSYGARLAGQVLQQRWEEEVLGGIRGLAGDDVSRTLFTENEGLAWKFVAGTGKPFITRNQFGWCAPKETEARIPLREEFFDFLNTGPKSIVPYEPSYMVNIETLPIEVNEGASIKPYSCVLSLQCLEGKTMLENYNYPQKQTFEWSPEKCGEVTLSILFTDLTVTRVYEGKLGFAQFLAEFTHGARTFGAEEFPRGREKLEKMGVTSIKVSYKITGSRPVTLLLEKNPARVPIEIVAVQ